MLHRGRQTAHNGTYALPGGWADWPESRNRRLPSVNMFGFEVARYLTGDISSGAGRGVAVCLFLTQLPMVGIVTSSPKGR